MANAVLSTPTTQGGHKTVIQLPPAEGVTCWGTNKRGTRCGAYPIAGSRVCRLHGGKAPAGEALRKERLVNARALALTGKLGQVVRQDPKTILLDSLYGAFGMSLAFRFLIQDVDVQKATMSLTEMGEGGNEDEGLSDRELIAQYERWNREAARLAKMALDVGIEERIVRMAESQATTMVTVIRQSITQINLDPTIAQKLMQTIAGNMRLVGPGAGETEDE